MIDKSEIDDVVGGYDQDKISIATLGSHSALNIFKGARDEGLKTICLCREKDEITYRRFPLVDEMIRVRNFSDLMGEKVQQRLRESNAILVPHGSFNALLAWTKSLTTSGYRCSATGGSCGGR